MARETYAQRIQRGMSSYLASHPDASDAEARRFARGHGATGEHGVTVTALGNSDVIVVSFHDPKKLPQAIRAAEKYGERASVTVVGKNGKSVTLFSNPGHMAGRSLETLKGMGPAKTPWRVGLVDNLAASGGGGHDKTSDDDLAEAFPDGDDDVDEYQLIVH